VEVEVVEEVEVEEVEVEEEVEEVEGGVPAAGSETADLLQGLRLSQECSSVTILHCGKR
jgi:hypothetical protein